jgi:general secretion pathway protein I
MATLESSAGRKRAAGFSLIEVLVAFTILALSLGTLYQVFSQGLRAADMGDDYTRAVVHARSQLARLGLEAEGDEAAMEGELDDGYRWQAVIEPYAPAEGEPPFSESGLEPVLVRVRVSWGHGPRERSFVLETVRLRLPS